MYKHSFCLSSAKYWFCSLVPIVKCAHYRHYNLTCLSVANNTDARLYCWQWTHFTMGPNEQNQHFAELRQKICLHIYVVVLLTCLPSLDGKLERFVTKKWQKWLPNSSQTDYSHINLIASLKSLSNSLKMVLKLWGGVQNPNPDLGPGWQPGSVCSIVANNDQLFICQNAIIYYIELYMTHFIYYWCYFVLESEGAPVSRYGRNIVFSNYSLSFFLSV